MVELLLSKGVKVSMANKVSALASPTHLAPPTSHCSNIQIHMIQKGHSPLWCASHDGQSDIVSLLLQHRAEVDRPNDVRHSNTQ